MRRSRWILLLTLSDLGVFDIFLRRDVHWVYGSFILSILDGHNILRYNDTNSENLLALTGFFDCHSNYFDKFLLLSESFFKKGIPENGMSLVFVG